MQVVSYCVVCLLCTDAILPATKWMATRSSVHPSAVQVTVSHVGVAFVLNKDFGGGDLTSVWHITKNADCPLFTVQ
jgi:hypothetical protein